MGNCCLERPCRRGGGGGSAGGAHYARTSPVWAEDGDDMGDTKEEAGHTHAPAATTKVKIRITRKQLEELLRRVEDGEKHGGAPVQEVISQFLFVASTSSNFRHRGREEGQCWRPSLQTIPE